MQVQLLINFFGNYRRLLESVPQNPESNYLMFIATKVALLATLEFYFPDWKTDRSPDIQHLRWMYENILQVAQIKYRVQPLEPPHRYPNIVMR
jgi:hypothetical protein